MLLRDAFETIQLSTPLDSDQNTKRGRALLFVTLVVSFAVAACGQTTTQNPLPKSSLSSTFQTLGWFNPATPGPIDVLAVGTLTYYSPDGSTSSSVPVTIKCRGNQHFRIDVNDPSGAHTTIVNGLGGTFKTADGKAHGLSASASIGVPSPIFPFLLDELDPANPKTTVEDLGIANAPPGIGQRLRVTLPTASDFVAGLKSRASEKTLWFAADGTPARIDFFRVASDNHFARVPFSLVLSDYRKVGGITVAFQQLEQLDGKSMKLLTLQSVVIGPSAGISDGDFTVTTSTVAGGAQ